MLYPWNGSQELTGSSLLRGIIQSRKVAKEILGVAADNEQFILQIWDSMKGVELHSLDYHKDSITRIQMSSDKHYLVSSGNDGNVIFWDGKVIVTKLN